MMEQWLNKKWTPAILGAILMFFSAPGQTYVLSAYLLKYEQEFAVSSVKIASIYALMTLLSSLLIMIFGHQIDRIGVGRIGFVIALLMLFTTFMNSILQLMLGLFIGLFLLRFMGQGLMTILSNTYVSKAYDKNRGVALGMVQIGGSLAAVVLPPLNYWIIDLFGWRVAWLSLSGLILLILIPTTFLIRQIDHKHRRLTHMNQPFKEDIHLQPMVLFRSLRFWTMGLYCFSSALLTSGLIFHIYTFVGEKGLNQHVGALALSAFSLPSFIFPLIFGKIISMKDDVLVMALGLTFQWIGICALSLSTIVGFVYLGMFLYGIGICGNLIGLNHLWVRVFGKEQIGRVQSLAVFFGVLGSSIGPATYAILQEKTGSISVTLTMNLIVLLVMLAFIVSIRFKIKRSHQG